jgi:hypothetical protein
MCVDIAKFKITKVKLKTKLLKYETIYQLIHRLSIKGTIYD